MSTIAGFLVGTATGAAGKYFADKYTDQRRKGEWDTQAINSFKNIKKQMPELIAEFKADLSKKDNQLIREFFVLPNKNVCLGGSEKLRLIYYEDEHKSLRSKIDILENHGFLTDVTLSNAPIYRMNEDFVSLILKHG
jgi:hypothetical protein